MNLLIDAKNSDIIVKNQWRKKMRVIAVDYGDARTGIAVSDITGFLVGRAYTVTEWNREKVIDAILSEVENSKAERIVLGYPKNMNGTIGPRGEKSEELKKLLEERTDIPVILWDERRTTVDADRILRESGKKGKNKRNIIDAVAASLILEGYLQTL